MPSSSRHPARSLKKPPPKQSKQSNSKSSKRQRASSASETDAPVSKRKKKATVDSSEDDQPSPRIKTSKKKGKRRAKNRPKSPSIEEVDDDDSAQEVDNVSEKASEASVNEFSEGNESTYDNAGPQRSSSGRNPGQPSNKERQHTRSWIDLYEEMPGAVLAGKGNMEGEMVHFMQVSNTLKKK